MNSSSFISVFLVIVIICCLFLPLYELYPNSFTSSNSTSNSITPPINLSSNYAWPVPGYTKITSKFGKRNSPTARSFFLSFRN